ncbi:MAG: ATP-binding protein, partial [Acetobacteraceae bacterium]
MADLPGDGSGQPVETTTEAVALGAIVQWSADQPLWQRDALRRLCDKEELDESDLRALLALCKEPSSVAAPLDTTHVSDPAAASATVVVKAIREVRHVNALAGDQVLSFGKKGLTVIYGDNGSGKSGYARILKQACRARGARNEKILPNIYSNTSGPATARIEFLADQQNCAENWQHGNAADALLSSVSIFDSKSANVHVEGQNDLAYTPFPLKLLSSLAQACQTIKDRLNSEITAIEAQTPSSLTKPSVKAHTAVGQLLGGLSANTKPTDVEKLATLSAAEVARFAALKVDLAADPARQARQLQQLKVRLDADIDRLESLVAATSDENVSKLRIALAEYETATAAAHTASTTLFAGDPLPEIGSAVWRALWEAARGYSDKVAYPGVSFPNTISDARCVLCQQKLEPAAADRLSRFAGFVKNESKRREDLAWATYKAAHDAIAATGISAAVSRALINLIRGELGADDLAERLQRGLTLQRWRHRTILRLQRSHMDTILA